MMRLPFLFMDGRSARIPDKIRPMPERGGEDYLAARSERGGEVNTVFKLSHGHILSHPH